MFSINWLSIDEDVLKQWGEKVVNENLLLI